jgi:hypothetical protein
LAERLRRKADRIENRPELRNKVIQKGLAFDRDWSGTVLTRAPKGAQRSCPAGSMAVTTSPPTRLMLWQPSRRSADAIAASVRGSISSPFSLSVLMSPFWQKAHRM